MRSKVLTTWGSISLLIVITCAGASAQSTSASRAETVFVHSKFGGQIFGFDIDQNGTEGILSEAQTLDNGDVLAAVETFDQRTGKILKVIAKKQSQDDFVTEGIVGNNIGIIEYEHEVAFLNVKRYYPILNPVSANQFTGVWKPPLKKDHLLRGVSRTQGSPNAAFFVYDNSGSFIPSIFEANVAANTFSKVIEIPDESFNQTYPPLDLNTITNQAVLAAPPPGNPANPNLVIVDFNQGTVNEFRGEGVGIVQGLAVDSQDNIACTTSFFDFSVQFYDLATQTGFSETLPGATSPFYSGGDVEYDPIHKVFLIAQENSSITFSGSSILVYDTQGNFLEAVNGLNFNGTFDVIQPHIALHPSKRAGFIDGPDPGVTEIQSFKY